MRPAVGIAFVATVMIACVREGAAVDGRQPATASGAAVTPAAHVVDVLDPDVVKMRDAIAEAHVAASMQKLVSFQTRNACSPLDDASRGIGAARDWIASELRANPGMEVKLQDFSIDDCGAPRTLANVVAWIPGKDATRAVVVGGHYDSRSAGRNDGEVPAPGANDSGSQTALVLEVARAMAGHTFDATVIFVAFAAEEQGLKGSKAFVDDLPTLFAGAKVEAMLDCDIVGGDTTANDEDALRRFRLFSPGIPREEGKAPDGTADDTSPARGVMHFIAQWGHAYVPSMIMQPNLREDRVGRGGDHIPFLAKAIPAVRFIETNETLAHQHSPDDVMANVTPAYTARLARVVTSVLASLARAPIAPKSWRAKRDGKALVVEWVPSPEEDHAVIALRRATESTYEAFVDVPSGVTRATIDPARLGLDGAPFWVSVYAVDDAGHGSLYGYPELRCDAAACAAPTDALDVTAVVK